jgi:hypothetical protein
MMLLFVIQFALTYPNGGPNGQYAQREYDISRIFPFVTNGVLAGVCLVSCLIQGREEEERVRIRGSRWRDRQAPLTTPPPLDRSSPRSCNTR